MGSWTLIDLFVLVGTGVILPLALPTRGWWVATASVGLAFTRPGGWSAALLVVPWLVVAGVAVVATVKASVRVAARDLARWAEVLAAGYSVVAAIALLRSRFGGELFGIGEPIVELTAVHFTYAGTGALTLARWNLVAQPDRLAWLAVVLTAVAPPVVAGGFVTGAAWPQVGGAVLMTAGVWSTSVLHLRVASTTRGSPGVRALLGISGLAPWVPMVLAVSWAAAQHADLPALSIDDMVRVHGTLNAVGFTLCGLVAWRLSRRDRPAVGELVA